MFLALPYDYIEMLLVPDHISQANSVLNDTKTNYL